MEGEEGSMALPLFSWLPADPCGRLRIIERVHAGRCVVGAPRTWELLVVRSRLNSF